MPESTAWQPTAMADVAASQLVSRAINDALYSFTEVLEDSLGGIEEVESSDEDDGSQDEDEEVMDDKVVSDADHSLRAD